MIKLAEILHTIRGEKEAGLTETDNWKITDANFLMDMGFKVNGIYHFGMDKPEIKVYHKKGEGFIVEDKTKNEKRVFPKFNELMEYFSKYQQKWENAPYNE
jgi:hypothetical protein